MAQQSVSIERLQSFPSPLLGTNTVCGYSNLSRPSSSSTFVWCPFREHTHRKAATYKGPLDGLLKRCDTNQSSAVLHLTSGLKKIILLSMDFLSKLAFQFQWQKSKNIQQKYVLHINSKTDKVSSYVLYRHNFNYFMLAERFQIHLYHKRGIENTEFF